MNCVSTAGTFVTTAQNKDWSEKEISWSNAPAYEENSHPAGGSMIGPYGAIDADRWYGFSVTQAVSEALDDKQDAVSFRVSVSDGECEYSSIQSGRDPKLMVTF